MTTAYPAAKDAYGDPTGVQVQGSTTPTHSGHHTNHNDAIEAIETKLGTGASVAAANTLLRGTGAGATAFAQLAAGDIAPGAIATADLAAAAATAIQFAAVAGTSTNSTTMGDVTGGSINFVGAGGQVYIFLTFVTVAATGAAASLTININENGTDTISAMFNETVPLSTNSTKSYFGPLNTVWTGARTIKLRWAVASAASTASILGARMLLAEFKR